MKQLILSVGMILLSCMTYYWICGADAGLLVTAEASMGSQLLPG